MVNIQKRRMAHNSNTCFSVLVVLALTISSNTATAAISCNEATEHLMPCQSFLTGTGNVITAACCQGAKALSKATVSETDHKTVCRCLKQAALLTSVNSDYHDRAKLITELCKVAVPVSVQPDVDCDRITLNGADPKTNGYGLLYSPTEPGSSPGMGHSVKPPPRP